MVPSRFAASLLVIALAAVLGACGGSDESGASSGDGKPDDTRLAADAACPGCNVILLSIDTLGASVVLPSWQRCCGSLPAGSRSRMLPSPPLRRACF